MPSVAVVEVNPSQKGKKMTRHCPSNAVLHDLASSELDLQKQDEVATHVSQCEDCQGFLESIAKCPSRQDEQQAVGDESWTNDIAQRLTKQLRKKH